MHTKGIYHTAKGLSRVGCAVLRFNFRGVGRSQGYFDNGPGELADAASALDWLQLQNPDSRSCWIAGMSFGTWIAMQLLMRRPEVDSFVCVGPPANLYDFSFLAPCPSSGLIVHGDKDIVAPAKDVTTLVEKLRKFGFAADLASVRNRLVSSAEGGDSVGVASTSSSSSQSPTRRPQLASATTWSVAELAGSSVRPASSRRVVTVASSIVASRTGTGTSVLPSDTISSTVLPSSSSVPTFGFWPTTSSASVPSLRTNELVTLNPRSSSSRVACLTGIPPTSITAWLGIRMATHQ